MARISRRRLAIFGSAIVVAVAAANALAWRAWHPAESRQTPVITVDGVDQKVSLDLRRSLERAAPEICAALEASCRFRVAVRVSQDQERFDDANPGPAGYFAVSGNRTIQIVSPLEGHQRGMSYEDGLMIAAHAAASADVHAYTLTASLAHRFGDDRVNELLRSSGDVPGTLGTNWRAIDADWHEYVREVCVQ